MASKKQLLGLIPKKHHAVITSSIDNGRLDPQGLLGSLRSESTTVRKGARETLRGLIGVDRLYLKKKSGSKKSAAHAVPLLDLMRRPERNQFQLLRSLVLVNKDFRNAFSESLAAAKKDIKSVVSLCHFFDLTRRFPKNDFQHRVGFHIILDDPKIGFKSRCEYHIFLQDNRFHLYRNHYFGKQHKDETFPNTKEGFIRLLDVFVPVLKSSVIGLDVYWGLLRPLTKFDKEMLKRFNIVQDQKIRKDIVDPTLFKINPETISHWDMSYLDQLSD